MSTAQQDPFASADPWDASTGGGDYLPEGEFVVTIDEVKDETAVSSGKPKAIFEMSNSQGKAVFRCPYSATFLNKIVAAYDAAGVPRPQPGEYNPNDNCRIRLDVLKRLEGKQVGVVIKNEPDQTDPTKQWATVQGCVHPSRISDAPVDTAGLPPAGQQANGGPKIPF